MSSLNLGKICFGAFKMPAAPLQYFNISKKFSASSTSNTSRKQSNSLMPTPRKVVFISQSTNVFANLAFEDWLYRNFAFANRHILFLWSNSPCVVIGRHQNPYVEANIPYLENAKVPFARRNSGGGTVYHDDGNLNCTFFTPRNDYNRKWNLNIICKTLQDDFDIAAKIDERDNILVEEAFKVGLISGTAAKLGRLSAYHHCTLLVNSDKSQMRLALQGDKTIDSKATESIPSQVKNLVEFSPNLTVEALLGSLGRQYLEAAMPGTETSAAENYKNADGLTLINPTNDWFPGIDDLVTELTSWNCKYGKTPTFKITRPVRIPSCLAPDTMLNVSVQAYHGMINEVKVVNKGACSDLVDLIQQDIGTGLKGARYTPEIFKEITNRLRLPRHLTSQRSAV